MHSSHTVAHTVITNTEVMLIFRHIQTYFDVTLTACFCHGGVDVVFVILYRLVDQRILAEYSSSCEVKIGNHQDHLSNLKDFRYFIWLISARHNNI